VISMSPVAGLWLENGSPQSFTARNGQQAGHKNPTGAQNLGTTGHKKPPHTKEISCAAVFVAVYAQLGASSARCVGQRGLIFWD
jgi:hypothetical protein